MLKLLKSGLFSTLQDLGRFGYRNKGVPVSGVMDAETVTKLNRLLDNPINALVMEITMTGPTAVFEEDTFFVIGGAEMQITLNNKPIANCTIYQVRKGDVLSYGRLENGFRSYLAVKGGFYAETVLGSSAMYFPITKNGCLKENDEISYEKHSVFEPKILGLKIASFLNETELYVYRGPEFNMLDDRQLEQLFSKDFTVAKENNRMAYQLSEVIKGHKASILTSATLPGTVQFTPSGKLIILMKDGQTTGGYPRILQLSDKAIAVLAQKKYGDAISFKLL